MNEKIENLLLIGSFLGIVHSAFYCVPFVALLALRGMRSLGSVKVDEELRKELVKVQQVSSQLQELEYSINNVRAAVSLGRK